MQEATSTHKTVGSDQVTHHDSLRVMVSWESGGLASSATDDESVKNGGEGVPWIRSKMASSFSALSTMKMKNRVAKDLKTSLMF